MILAVVIALFILAFMAGHVCGWRSGIRIARIWEGMYRDANLRWEVERADSDEEASKATEVRELRRMWDGV